MFKQEAKLDLQTHLFLADTISYPIHNLVIGKKKYNHQVAVKILDIVEEKMNGKFDKNEDLVRVIIKARKCKKRIRNSILLKIISKLDDDFLRLGDEVFEKYGYLYYSY